MRFLITAGPTREPIDPVRYLSNRSSGKMGYAIAEAALDAGHDVILVSGPVAIDPPEGAKLISVSTSDEMFDAVHQHAGDRDIIVMCAAVADYKPATVSPNKIKKGDHILSLRLLPTRDILASLAKPHRQFLLVGFAAETQNVEENAQKKLQDKNCDVVVANDVSNMQSGMESDENEVIIVFRSGKIKKFPRAQKKIIARDLVKIFSNMREKCLTKKV